MTAREWLDAAQERADAAHDEVVRLCEGKRFTMTVPVEDTDSDVVLDAPTEDLPRAIAALRAVLDLHVAGDGASQGYLRGGFGYGYIEPYCAGCESSDEYAVEWPCGTVRAIAAALDPAAVREQIGETP